MPNVKITPHLVQQIRDAIDIIDIASEVTRLQKRGQRYLGLCPFHNEKTPSFSVDPNQGLFYCFGCGAGGDAIKLFMQHTGDDFPAAIESLAHRYTIPLPIAESDGPPRRDPTKALDAAARFFSKHLRQSDGPKEYLDRRQIPSELRERYGLGYAPDSWDRLLQSLGQKVSREDLEATGLVARSQKSGKFYDRFRHRLMFPIATPSGRLVGFGGRTLGDDRAKYLNTSETDYFHKGSLLYGFHQAKRSIRATGRALLVEGYFDVLGAAAAGIDWAVAGMGTALTAEQAKLLARYADEVILAYDGDEAGEKACRKSLPLLLAAGLSVRRAEFPDGHDPDSLRLERGADAVRQAVEEAADAVTREIHKLTPPEARRDPQLRSSAADAISELLRPIRDGVLRYTYGQAAAERLMIPLDLLWKKAGRGIEASPAPAAPLPRTKPKEVRSEEEKALQLLLHTNGDLPALADLPPAEIFIDPDCRNIYATFCALYRGEDGTAKPPGASEIVSRLNREEGAIDRLARLLLEDFDSAAEDLALTLQRLEHRWRKRRQPELIRQIRQAQREGDQILLDQLLEEKTSLSRRLHPDSDGRLW